MELTRRDFLQSSTLATATTGLSVCQAAAAQPTVGRAKNVIVLFLVGGPSHLETWDPKPDAPSEVRGPFRAISTSVPGTRIGEHLPRLANLAHRYAIIRTVNHDAAPIHEAGQQLLQTGRLSRPGFEFPHFGAVLARHLGPTHSGAAPFVMLPSPIGNTGISISHGQGAGLLGAAYEPQVQSRFTHQLPQADRERYGKTAFGDACARSLQLVGQGTRCVVVNMFDTVYDRITWDCHADRHSLSSTLDDYRRTLCPALDRALATLVDDLHQRGMLDETLVLAMGEFGRTPRLNANGGRDHWPGCWSIVMAGGGVRGGQVVGTSDRLGAEPMQRPVMCAAVAASVYHAFGQPAGTQLRMPGGRSCPLTDAAPIRELTD
ncbi:MAG: DUF1501 domain-containing protein [Gemmataceae bacterium]|nr:DUF1501 domain-containing protein [Gemmataceae bacterium]